MSHARGASAGAGEALAPRSRKGAETRARLLEAAKRVFEEKGFLDARISDISERAEERLLTAPPATERITATSASGRITGSDPDAHRERIRRANRRYLERYRDEARIMGVIEQVSRYDEHVNAVRAATQKHFAERAERSIRRLQEQGVADPHVDPAIAATALGAMVARFAELWLVQGYASYDFEEAVEQLTTLWCNALRIGGSSHAAEPVRRRSRRFNTR